MVSLLRWGQNPKQAHLEAAATAECAELHLTGGKGRAPEASTKQQIPTTAAGAGLDFLAQEQLDLTLPLEMRDEQIFTEKL